MATTEVSLPSSPTQFPVELLEGIEQPITTEASEPAQPDLLKVHERKKEWEDPAPFMANSLMLLVNPVKDQRTFLLDEVDRMRRRRIEIKGQITELEAQIFQLEYQELEKQEQIQKTTEFLACCSLLGETGRAIDPLMQARLSALKQKPGKAMARDTETGEAFSTKSCLKIFMDHPNTNLTVKEVAQLAPAAERSQAKRFAGIRLSYLETQGKINRVDKGIYRLVQPGAPAIEAVVAVEAPRQIVVPPLRSHHAAAGPATLIAVRKPGRPRKVFADEQPKLPPESPALSRAVLNTLPQAAFNPPGKPVVFRKGSVQ